MGYAEVQRTPPLCMIGANNQTRARNMSDVTQLDESTEAGHSRNPDEMFEKEEGGWRTHQLPLPPPFFFVFLGSASTWPLLAK